MDLLTQKRKEEFSKKFNIEENNELFEESFKSWLIEKSLKQIIKDVKEGDVESIEGLLEHCEIEHLANYLPENF